MVQPFLPPSDGADSNSNGPESPEKGKSGDVPLSTRDLEITVTKLKAAAAVEDVGTFDYLHVKITDNINKDNAVKVLGLLDKEEAISADGKPSAPPESPSVESKAKRYLEDQIVKLRNDCLSVVDNNPLEALSSHDIPALTYDRLHEILMRDTLINPQEDLLFECMWRWGYTQCKDTTQMKTTLRDLPYSIRYGLMSFASFKRLKYEIRILLDEDSYKSVKSYLQQRKKCLPVASLPNNWSKPRHNQTDHSYGESTKSDNCFIKCCVCWALLFD